MLLVPIDAVRPFLDIIWRQWRNCWTPIKLWKCHNCHEIAFISINIKFRRFRKFFCNSSQDGFSVLAAEPNFITNKLPSTASSAFHVSFLPSIHSYQGPVSICPDTFMYNQMIYVTENSLLSACCTIICRYKPRTCQVVPSRHACTFFNHKATCEAVQCRNKKANAIEMYVS